MLTNTHGLLLGSRGRTAQELFCLSSSSKYSERPNTSWFLIHVLLWLCTIRQANANFSFLLLTVILSILQVLSAPWGDSSDYRRSKIIENSKKSQREMQAEKNIHKASKHKKSLLLEQIQPFCSYAKSRSHCTMFCWGTQGMREVYSVFNFSNKAKTLIRPFHFLKASIL